ncbi:MAG: ABC transporter permease [Candidatus Accumulibacter sp.]|jgi:sulfonate transport system permease protein|nr:ABC transporter permease [Candidatus Accumulibacter necessarius]
MSEVSIPASTAVVASSRFEFKALIRRVQGLLVPAVLVIIWETVVRAGWVSQHLLPPPSELVTTLADLAGNGTLLGHIGISSLRVLIGFFIGAGLAVVVGAAVGLSRRTEALLDPTFQALRAIPSLAWVPLLLLWLGIDEAPKITLIAIGAFFPVYLNFVAGIQNVERKLVEVGGIYGLTGYRLIARIFLPAALPNLFTGLRSGLSLSWMFLVAAELIAASSGLGYLLTDGRETGRADLVIVAIIVLALLGKTSDSLLLWLEVRLLGWRDVFDTRPS